MNFEILPFTHLPAYIRWATGDFNNKEYGAVIFESVEDVDSEGDFDYMYGVIWADGTFGVYENYDEALWALISMEN
jgi:hypothetical protein